MSFEQLEVRNEICKALTELGLTEPTQIQQKAIPLIKAGKDLIGISKTGSGKTAAFGIPLLEKIVPGQGLQALVIAPTRELAVQIAQELGKFSKYRRCVIAQVYGGVSLDPQTDLLRRADICVGTPGRLKDHLNRRSLNLSKVNCLVLDEADKMVEMGFIEDIEYIVSYTPQHRQVLLFGATISREIDHLKQKYMHNPEIAEAETKVELLEQFYYNVSHQEKFSLLVHLLKKEETKRVMIFCSSRSTVELVARNLQQQGVASEMMHGKLTQNRRLRVISNFNMGRPKVLIASAVAARGLDIKDVSHVFNYDLSPDPQEYIHRVGRTARAGEAGKAITLLSERDYAVFGDILRRFPVQVNELPSEQFPRLRFDARRSMPEHRGGNFRQQSNHSRGGFRGDRSRSMTRDTPSWRR